MVFNPLSILRAWIGVPTTRLVKLRQKEEGDTFHTSALSLTAYRHKGVDYRYDRIDFFGSSQCSRIEKETRLVAVSLDLLSLIL